MKFLVKVIWEAKSAVGLPYATATSSETACCSPRGPMKVAETRFENSLVTPIAAPFSVPEIVNDFVVPALIVPKSLQISPDGTVPQSNPELAVTSTSAGISSRITTDLAFALPMFSAVTVYVMVSPLST